LKMIRGNKLEIDVEKSLLRKIIDNFKR